MVSVTAPCIAAWLLMPCKARNLLRKLRSPHDSMLPSKDQSRIPSSSKVFATSSGTTIRITFSPSINPSVSFSRISLFLIQQVLNFCRSRILVGFSLTSVPSQMMRDSNVLLVVINYISILSCPSYFVVAAVVTRAAQNHE